MIRADADGRTVLEGSVARHALARGVPVARSSVVQPGERGFLAAVLSPGMRAISIPISETAGVSGLVMPGDRVGIILTYVLSSDVIDAGREVRASETVLANLRVLALDQRLQEVPNQAPVQAAAETVTQTIPIARTATLEVTPREAEMLTLATQLGELSMVLNSIRDGDVEEDAPSADLAAIAAAAGGGASAGPELRRALTLDSQVTTLLDRGTTGEAPQPLGADEPRPGRARHRQQRLRTRDKPDAPGRERGGGHAAGLARGNGSRHGAAPSGARLTRLRLRLVTRSPHTGDPS
jgi:Flp pilus assembly protein CpaB